MRVKGVSTILAFLRSPQPHHGLREILEWAAAGLLATHFWWPRHSSTLRLSRLLAPIPALARAHSFNFGFANKLCQKGRIKRLLKSTQFKTFRLRRS